MSLLLLVVLRAFSNIPCSKELTSLLGRVCSGRRHPDSKNRWGTRSWQTPSAPVWIRFLIVDLRSGGVPRLIVPTFMSVSRCSWISRVSLCTVKFRPWRSVWSKSSVPTCGKRVGPTSWIGSHPFLIGFVTSSWECCHGFVSSLWSRTWAFADWDCPEGNDPSSKKLQDELVLCWYPVVLFLQVEHISSLSGYWC